MFVCVWELKARRSLKPLRSTAPSSSIVLKRELLWYHITQLSVLTLDFDRWRFSAVVEHTPPSPQPFKRSWKAPLYIKTASTLPATSSDMTHARQRWPQQWLSSFDGKTLECLFTSGGLLACPSAFWSRHGRSGDAASRPGSAKGERERGGHIGSTCSETHGQNQTQSVWSEGGGVFFNGREGWACSCSVVFRFGREGWRRDIRIESVSNYNHPSPVIKMWANPRCCRQCEQQKAVAAKCRKLEKIRLRSNWEPFSMETFWVVTFFFFPQFWHFWQIRISEFKVSILRKNAGAQFLLYHFFFHRGANSHMSTKTHSLLVHAHPTHTFLHHYTATDMHTTSTPPPQRPPPLHPTALIKAERLQKVGANNKATFLHLSCFFFLRPLNYSCHQSVYKEVRLLSSSQEASDGGSSVLRTQCK